MRQDPPIRRTMSESSFLQSLASIHLEPRLRRSSMSNNTVWVKGKAPSSTNQKWAAHPGQTLEIEVNAPHVAPAALENISKNSTLPDEKERIAIQGILRSQDFGKDKDVAHSTRRRVSFSHQEERINHRISDINFNLYSPPHNAFGSFSMDIQDTINPSTPTSSNAIAAASAKSSFYCLPPQPPRIFPRNDKNWDISSVFQTSQTISLPFQITPTTRPSRPMRRYSMLEMDQIHGQQPACRAVSHTGVSPSSLSLQRRRSDGANLGKSDQQPLKEHCYIRSDYTLGEKARSTTHMIIESCPLKSLEQVSKLKNFDFAFVKRVDGSWTYAILAYRSLVEHGCDLLEEESMLFVMNEEGSTKMIKKRHWAEFVRCIATNAGTAPA